MQDTPLIKNETVTQSEMLAQKINLFYESIGRKKRITADDICKAFSVDANLGLVLDEITLRYCTFQIPSIEAQYREDEKIMDIILSMSDERIQKLTNSDTQYHLMENIINKFGAEEPQNIRLSEHYTTNPICNMTNDELSKKINLSKTKYKHTHNYISEQAFLWVAKKDGCAPIYIFNTMHLLTGIDANDIFGDALNNIIDKVDTVFTEVELNIHPEDTTVSPHNESSVYELDHIIAEKSANMGKVLKPLENSEIREALGCHENEIQSLYQSTNEQLQKGEVELLMQASQNYLTHANPFTINKEDNKYFATKNRNFFWIESLLFESSNNKTCLVACGTSHSSGKYGLPNLLAANGYQLEPLMKTPPPSKKDIARTLVYGHHSLGMFAQKRAAQSENVSLPQHQNLPHCPK